MQVEPLSEPLGKKKKPKPLDLQGNLGYLSGAGSDCPKSLYLCGFPGLPRDKKSIVWGQKVDSLGTKSR